MRGAAYSREYPSQQTNNPIASIEPYCLSQSAVQQRYPSFNIGATPRAAAYSHLGRESGLLDKDLQ